ncbi:DUF5345 family protein [Cohnella mopanensis]|uniref:DUF5345 family protein n=1 Tax=Cohnella mopanensis TaxID=2911966 RepID=UPI001EF77512|nr:DUF5345 family protein [Cohnella mopanensis]
MKPTDQDQDNKLITDLRQDWEVLEKTYSVTPAPLDVWESLVHRQRQVTRRRLWRDLLLFWSVAVPLVSGVLFLGSGISAWFWLLQGISVIVGIPLAINEFKASWRKGASTYD